MSLLLLPLLCIVTHYLQLVHAVPTHDLILHKRQSTNWSLQQTGNSGVAAMMFVVLNDNMVLVLDKVENNPITTPNGHPAWGALYNMNTNTASPIQVNTNTFCAGGAFISNGTFISTGGTGVVSGWETADGWQGLRLMQPCTSLTGAGCTLFDDPSKLSILGERWYPTVVRLYDGSAAIIGGTAIDGFWNDQPGANTASFEYFPPKFWMPYNFVVPSDFLLRTAPVNLFPIAFAMTDGRLFLAANNQTIVYDTDYNYEIRLPDIPNGYRVTYPFTGGGLMLPLAAPDYLMEVLICGGSNISDTLQPSQMSSQHPASDKCFRMTLTEAGVAQGWAMETMPEGRVMPDMILLPTGDVLIVNGAKTGAAGYLDFPDAVGQSNADHPAFRPVIYKPKNAAGSRFVTTGMPTSNIARMYHSVATLTPMGNVMIAGSNANADVYTFPGLQYPTEYRVEYLNPPWMSQTRPTITNPPAKMNFNTQYTFNVTVPAGLNTTASKVQVALMDIAFATHSVHSTERHVFLAATLSAAKTSVTITGPRDGGVYQPGPGWLYFIVDGVVSKGKKVMIGTGGNPPVPYY